jgi:hypothetical protein
MSKGIKMKNLLKCILFGFIIIGIMACNSIFSKNKLSREKAKEIITKSIFNENGNLTIAGVFALGDRLVLRQDEERVLHNLANNGFIKFVLRSQMWGANTYNISLTNNGLKYLIKKEVVEETFNCPKGEYAIMKLGYLELNDITGIVLSGDNKNAKVDFNFRYKPNTIFGEKWHEEGNIGAIMKASDFVPKYISEKCEATINFNYRIVAPNMQNGTVKMVLYDDGWRILTKQEMR